ncbi:MAG: polyisoprenoid-binding protein YceI [Limisphaerales bacterium]|jgi:polyisoprenoid-binding protein YceI
MNLIYSVFLLLSMTAFEPAHVVLYKLNGQSSTIEWTGKAVLDASSLTGKISPSGGQMLFDHGNINQGFLEIDMTSIMHEEEKLVKHLMSADFFDVENFPTARFDLKGVRAAEDNLNWVDGDLTIRGTTLPQTVSAKIAQRGQNIVFSFELTIDRTTYGVNHNSPSVFKDIKDDIVADEIVIKCELVFMPKG